MEALDKSGAFVIPTIISLSLANPPRGFVGLPTNNAASVADRPEQGVYWCLCKPIWQALLMQLAVYQGLENTTSIRQGLTLLHCLWKLT